VSPRAVLDEVVKRKIPSSRRESNPKTLTVLQILSRLNLSDVTSLIVCTVMFVVLLINNKYFIHSLFTQFVGVYRHTKFHTPSSNSSLVIAVELKPM
jgi:hypothetical protein